MNSYSGELQIVGIGLLFMRLVFGLVMAAHGAQKLFGWFGGYGLNKTGEFFVQLGFPPGRAFAAAASVAESHQRIARRAWDFSGPSVRRS